tara:strand:+ start:201 stop:587 length:387 start_codon:yes stop_codon:yes gene_type:complete
MPKSTWKLSEIGIRTNGLPSDLRVKQPIKSPYFIAEFLPDKDVDPDQIRGETKVERDCAGNLPLLKLLMFMRQGREQLNGGRIYRKKKIQNSSKSKSNFPCIVIGKVGSPENLIDQEEIGFVGEEILL